MDETTTETARIAADFIREYGGNIFDQAKSLTASQIKKLKASHQIGFREYLEQTIARAGSIKTILNRDQSIALQNIYVQTEFQSQGIQLIEDEFFWHFADHKRVIVAGTAGSGKSMFVKHAVQRCIQSNSKKIPIYVELRNINHFSSSIMHYILEQLLRTNMHSFDLETLDYGLKSGLFTVFLDGLDEIDHDRRETYLLEIDFMARKYRELQILISTRPEETALSLEGFNVYHVKPLSKVIASHLVEKLNYDEEVREKFQQSLNDEIYDQHTEFASNPLLLTLLLLTFDHVGEIPGKMHIFFSQAFEILVMRHDRLKSLYRRKTYTNFDLEELKKVYSVFCTLSYADNQISFTEEQCDHLLQEALAFHKLEGNVEELKKDLIYSFSMIRRDGLFLTFVHRSFQEYFCAYFLSQSEGTNLYEIVDSLAERGQSEQCLRMLYDISPDRITLNWILPLLEKHTQNQPHAGHLSDLASILKKFYTGIRIEKDLSINLGPKTLLLEKVVLCASLLFGDADEKVQKTFSMQPKKLDKKTAERIFGGYTPFQGKLIEPTSEDNEWLNGSWVETHLSCVLELADKVLHHVKSVETTRHDNSNWFRRSTAPKKHGTEREKFEVRSKPKFVEDPRTGKKRKVQEMRNTVRRVINLKDDASD